MTKLWAYCLCLTAACSLLVPIDEDVSSGPSTDAGSPVDSTTPSADTQGGCPVGYADCDNNPSNGCETSTTDSAGHCGFCGNVCPSASNGFPVCVDSVCRVACNPGYDNCDNNAANGCEKDVTSDPANCGVCNHACVGNCTDALCAPTTVLSALASPTALAAVAVPLATPTRVFFLNAGSLSRVDADGQSFAPVTGATGNLLRVDDQRVYYLASSTELGWCDLPCPGGGPPKVYRRPAPEIFGDLSVRDTTRAIMTAFLLVPGVASGSSVLAFDKTALVPGDAALPTTVITSLDPQAFAVAVTNNTTNIYFFAGPQGLGDIYQTVNGAANQTATAIVDSSVVQSGLAVEGDRLFFVTSEKQLMGCLTTSCRTTRKLYGSAEAGYGITTDSQFVYWADPGTGAAAFGDGRILRCPLAGCVGPPTVFAKGQFHPAGVALSATDIYWTTTAASNGAILRIPK